MADAFCDPAESFDPRDLRSALGCFGTGVTVVTIVAPDGVPIGLTCNSFSSVSLSPPLVLWSLSLRSPNLSNFLQAPHFAVNILAADQIALARRFAQSISNKFDGIAHQRGIGGVPLLDDTAAGLECRNETRYYTGDHVIFIGHVLRYSWRACAPLLFCHGRYKEPGADVPG
jgi:flavin reductase (DIM6/NTAB) family NADH-FMN oxidoreductase RutF